MARRPTHKERSGKLRQALEAFESGAYQIIDEDRHFTADCDELGSASAKEHWSKVHRLLSEILAAGGADCYVGSYPPYPCYHPPFMGVELFAFAWESESAGCRMYLKFGIKLGKKSKKPTYLYLNCHEDAPEKRDR